MGAIGPLSLAFLTDFGLGSELAQLGHISSYLWQYKGVMPCPFKVQWVDL